MTDSPTEREAESTWTRLRRRKVVQWGVVYVAAAWGFLQGLEYVSEAFEWPTQLRQVALLLLLIGLPIVLVLAWYHGDRGQQRISTPEFAILTVLLLLGGGAFWYYQRATETTAVTSPSAPSAPAFATDASIAVLPFVNMSPDKEQEYFADGISEELLNLLAQVPELRVIARTSSFSFKGKDVEIAEIARRLNVANVLEGSVRKSGDRLRITAQLVRASDSSHVWSETYDRTLDDIFAMQDEIAAAVVEQLKIRLLRGPPKLEVTKPRAYALILQAREIGKQGNPTAVEQAISLYKAALAIDSTYAPAWDGLASAYFSQIDLAVRTTDQALPLARDAVQRALVADPTYAPAYARAALLDGIIERDLAKAVNDINQGLAHDPVNLEVISSANWIARRLGRLDQAIALAEYLVARDPVNAFGHDHLGFNYYYADRLDDALASFRTVLTLSPEYAGERRMIGEVLMLSGHAEEALEITKQEPVEGLRLAGLSQVYHALGRQAESDAVLSELIRKHGRTLPADIAAVFAVRGDADRAFEWLEKAAEVRDSSLGALAIYPTLRPMHSDRRWLPFLRRHGMAPEQLAAIKFDVKVPN